MLLLPGLPGRLLRQSRLSAAGLAPQAARVGNSASGCVGGRAGERSRAMKRVHQAGETMLERRGSTPALDHGTAVTRRRALTIVGAAAGLPLLCSADRSRSAPLLHQWTGTSLGSPSQLLLYHDDGATAARIVSECASEIERLERIFALYRADSEIARLNHNGRLDFPSIDLLTVLSQCQALSALSDGAFDVTVQPLWTLY